MGDSRGSEATIRSVRVVGRMMCAAERVWRRWCGTVFNCNSLDSFRRWLDGVKKAETGHNRTARESHTGTPQVHRWHSTMMRNDFRRGDGDKWLDCIAPVNSLAVAVDLWVWV